MPNAVATANCAARASDFLLSGILRCGSCGTAYIGMSANGNGGHYRADHGHALRNVRKSGRGWDRTSDPSRVKPAWGRTAGNDQVPFARFLAA
jgi:hypothetical protein